MSQHTTKPGSAERGPMCPRCAGKLSSLHYSSIFAQVYEDLSQFFPVVEENAIGGPH